MNLIYFFYKKINKYELNQGSPTFIYFELKVYNILNNNKSFAQSNLSLITNGFNSYYSIST